jgi:hypothetical protein
LSFYVCLSTGAEDFLVRDAANEKKFQFNLAGSLKSAAAKPLLDGYKIHVTANVKPEPNQMKGNFPTSRNHTVVLAFI